MIETQVLADWSILCRPSGSLDWMAAVSLRHAIGGLLRPGVEVIIDLSRVEFIGPRSGSAPLSGPCAGCERSAATRRYAAPRLRFAAAWSWSASTDF